MAKEKKQKTLSAAEKKAKEQRKIAKQKKQAQSALCYVQDSGIHGSGVYASRDLTAGEKIIEYVGEKIDKAESERRAWAQYARAEEHGEAAVYIFTLSKKWDIDGNKPWNTARLLNHSCEPNCETWQEGKRIFIYALKDLKKDDELTFDYGFDVSTYADHPCRCGTKSCVGYIVSREQWEELEELKNADNHSAE